MVSMGKVCKPYFRKELWTNDGERAGEPKVGHRKQPHNTKPVETCPYSLISLIDS